MRYRAGWEPSEGDDGPSCWFPYGLHLECLPHLSHVKMQHMGFNFYSPPSEKCFALAQEKTWFPDSILFAFFFFLSVLVFLSLPWICPPWSKHSNGELICWCWRCLWRSKVLPWLLRAWWFPNGIFCHNTLLWVWADRQILLNVDRNNAKMYNKEQGTAGSRSCALCSR